VVHSSPKAEVTGSNPVGRATSAYKTGHSKTRRFGARSGDERAQEYALGAHDANLFRVDFVALSKGTGGGRGGSCRSRSASVCGPAWRMF
jgi:hypothetical protein